MTEKLTEEDCKRLTEFLGECWHELYYIEEAKTIRFNVVNKIIGE